MNRSDITDGEVLEAIRIRAKGNYSFISQVLA